MLTDISVQFQYYQRNPLWSALRKTMTSPTTLERRKEITWAVGLMALKDSRIHPPSCSRIPHSSALWSPSYSPKQQLLLENYVKECSILTRIDFKLSSLQPQRPVHPLTGMLVVTPAWQISLPTTTLCWLKLVKKKKTAVKRIWQQRGEFKGRHHHHLRAFHLQPHIQRHPFNTTPVENFSRYNITRT